MKHYDVNPNPTSQDIGQFLVSYSSGPWLLTLIEPDNPKQRTVNKWVSQADLFSEDFRRFIETYQGKRNIYFQLADLSRKQEKKAAKTDVKSVSYLWADLDPSLFKDKPESLRRLTAQHLSKVDVPLPTFIVDSGGGYHAYWRLKEPYEIGGSMEKCAEFERYLGWLAEKLNGDPKVVDASRILRLPGTINVADKHKMTKKGRVGPEPTGLIMDSEASYDIRVFGQSAPKGDGIKTDNVVSLDIWRTRNNFKIEPIDDLDALFPLAEHNKIKAMLLHGEDPDAIESWKRNGPDHDRSRLMWYVLCECVRMGDVSDEAMVRIQLDPKLPLSGHQTKQGKPVEYAIRQMERAKHYARDFVKTDEGKILPTTENVLTAFLKLGVSFRFDEWEQRMPIHGLSGFSEVNDASVRRLWFLIEGQFNFQMRWEKFWQLILDEATKDTYHPVKDYLAGLKWDGKERISRFLTDYAGADDTEFIRAVSRIVLVAAVTRVQNPGCKFDEMLVLESSEGKNKSSSLEALCVKPHWFADNLPLGGDSRMVLEAIQGRWIMESADLAGMRRAEVERVKAQLSTTKDSARLAYARSRTDHARSCVFIGTTNNDRYLQSQTGNRRFWPVKIRHFDLAKVKEDRDQIWAEAMEAFHAGESIRLPEALWEAAAKAQETRRTEDPWEAELGRYLDGKEGKLEARDLYALLGIEPKDRGRTQDHIRIRNCMIALGWRRPNESTQLARNKRYVACWVKGDYYKAAWLTVDELMATRHESGDQKDMPI